MRKNNKRALYESIMKNVSKLLKHTLNESTEFSKKFNPNSKEFTFLYVTQYYNLIGKLYKELNNVSINTRYHIVLIPYDDTIGDMLTPVSELANKGTNNFDIFIENVNDKPTWMILINAPGNNETFLNYCKWIAKDAYIYVYKANEY